jgi:hypothetical protein
MKGIKVYLSDCAIVKGLKLSQIRELFKPIIDKTFNWTNKTRFLSSNHLDVLWVVEE